MSFFQTLMTLPFDQLFSYGFVAKGRCARAVQDPGLLGTSTTGRGRKPPAGFQRASPLVIASRELFVRANRSNASEQCSICLNDFRCSKFIFRLSCLHPFHSQCIEQWSIVAPKGTCPVCRRPFILPFVTLEDELPNRAHRRDRPASTASLPRYDFPTRSSWEPESEA